MVGLRHRLRNQGQVGKTAKIRLEEIYRFANGPVALARTIRWDVLRPLVGNPAKWPGCSPKEVWPAKRSPLGVDTWGVDFVLLESRLGRNPWPALSPIIAMRWTLTWPDGYVGRSRNSSRAEIFAQSGLQSEVELNPRSRQLLAWQKQSLEILDAAETLLFMPDFSPLVACCGSEKSYVLSPRPS